MRRISRAVISGACPGLRIQATNPGHPGAQGQTGMANGISVVSLAVGDEHCQLLSHPWGCKNSCRPCRLIVTIRLTFFEQKVLRSPMSNAIYSRIQVGLSLTKRAPAFYREGNYINNSV